MVEYPTMNDECVIVVSSRENEEELLVWKVMTGELVKKIVMKGVIEDGSRNEVKLMIRLQDKNMIVCNGLDYYVLTVGDNGSDEQYAWKSLRSGHNNNAVSVLVALDDGFFLSGDVTGRLRVQQIEE